MSTGVSRDDAAQVKKDTQRKGPNYPRLNLQAGNKNEQEFLIKLLPRLAPPSTTVMRPNKEGVMTPYNKPWFFYGSHFKCGPERDQSLICLNEQPEEIKLNKKGCLACRDSRKVLKNRDDYTKEQIDRAKDFQYQSRGLWACYDLDKRKMVEYLDVTEFAIAEILNEHFQDSAGNFYDLTNIKDACCLRIKRVGSGFLSKYKYKAMFDPKYAILPSDVPIIKSTYKPPEYWITPLPVEEFNQIYTGVFGTQSADSSIDEPAQRERPVQNTASGLDDLSSMAGQGAAQPPQQPVQRERAPQQEPVAPPTSNSGNNALLDELASLGM